MSRSPVFDVSMQIVEFKSFDTIVKGLHCTVCSVCVPAAVCICNIFFSLSRTRGTGRRRVSRRDEEINGYPGPGGGRGHPRSIGMAPNADSHVKNGAYTEAKKPFELQATSFPPLPSECDFFPCIRRSSLY